MVFGGERAVLLFCVAHEGIEDVAPAAHIDSVYATTLAEAMAAGVDVLAYGIRLEWRDAGRHGSINHALYRNWCLRALEERTVLTLSGVTTEAKLLSEENQIKPDFYVGSIAEFE